MICSAVNKFMFFEISSLNLYYFNSICSNASVHTVVSFFVKLNNCKYTLHSTHMLQSDDR